MLFKDLANRYSYNKMNKYDNGKIYKVVCNVTGECYVGSTVNTLNHRLMCHKSALNSHKRGKIGYMTVFKIIERGDYKIELVEDYPTDSKFNLERRECYWVQQLDCINDSFKTGITVGCIKDKKEYNRQYKLKYREEIAKQKKQHLENIKYECDCGGFKYKGEKSKNKRHDNSKAHQFYIKYGYKIQDRAKHKITCECGTDYYNSSNYVIKKHEQTIKHKNYLSYNYIR